jgi:hypothetical protein
MRDLQRAAFLVVASAAVFAALPAHAQTEFTGAGEESELDCDGGGATIEGASNVLSITGSCTSLRVTGAGNRITIDLGTVSTIRVEGADNEIRWHAPGTAKPRLNVVGAGNRISRLR